MKIWLTNFFVLIFFGFIFYAIFWRTPRYWYKNSKTKLKFLIKVFLLFIMVPGSCTYIGTNLYINVQNSQKAYYSRSNFSEITERIKFNIERCKSSANKESSPLKLSIDCSAINEVSTYLNVVKALNGASFKNVYQTNKPAVIYSSSEPALGMTSIFYKDSRIYIRTKYLDRINYFKSDDEKILERVIDINL